RLAGVGEGPPHPLPGRGRGAAPSRRQHEALRAHAGDLAQEPARLLPEAPRCSRCALGPRLRAAAHLGGVVEDRPAQPHRSGPPGRRTRTPAPGHRGAALVVKVCFVTSNYPPEAWGGTVQVVTALARELRALGVEVAVITGSDRPH